MAELERINLSDLVSRVNALAKESPEIEYNCKACKDRKVIITVQDGYMGMRDCSCAVEERIRHRIEKSGLGEAFDTRTLNTFNPHNKSTSDALGACKRYIKESTKENLIIAGKIGSGKSHLAIAVAGEFLKQGVAVLYIGYRELTMQLKALAMDYLERQRFINSYKSVTILVIDDLYKASTTEADLAVIYEIINARYLAGLRTIITTEYSIKQLAEIEEAIASRLYENSEEYCVQITSDNYRFRKQEESNDKN